jgi:hypothetical protein
VVDTLNRTLDIAEQGIHPLTTFKFRTFAHTNHNPLMVSDQVTCTMRPMILPIAAEICCSEDFVETIPSWGTFQRPHLP